MVIIGLHAYKNILASGARDSAIGLSDLNSGKIIKKLSVSQNKIDKIFTEQSPYLVILGSP